jgi:hypothetical protein
MSSRFLRTCIPIFIGLCSASSIIRSPTREYDIIPSAGGEGSIARYTAVSNGERYYIKCSPSGDKLRGEFDILSVVEYGVSRLGEFFETEYEGKRMVCLSTELLGMSLFEYSANVGLIDPAIIMSVGTRMLNVIEAFHYMYGVNHRDGTARKWLLPSDGHLEPVLSGMAEARLIAKSDIHGYHRIVELQQMVMTIRYLVDLDERYYRVRTLPSRDINIICPDVAACPGNLREIIEYVLSVNPNRGSVPNDMYERLRELFDDGQMIMDQLLRRVGLNRDSHVNGVALFNPLSAGPDDKYYIVNRISDAVDFEAVSASRYGIIQGKIVVIRCNRGGNDEIRDDIFASYIETLILPGDVTCRVMEPVSPDLRSIAQDQGPAPFEFMARSGLRMLYIVERLHKFHGVAHRNLVAQSWAMRLRDHAILMNGHSTGVSVTEKDRTGIHRIRDLQQLVLTIRYMLDLDEQFYSLKKMKTRDADEICPPGICPDAFMTLVAYVFSVNPDNGEVPPGMYATIHEGLLAGLEDRPPSVGSLRTDDGREIELFNRVERGPETTEYAGQIKRSEWDYVPVTVICSTEDMGHRFMGIFDGRFLTPHELSYFRDPSVTSREVNCSVTERMGKFLSDFSIDRSGLLEIFRVVERMFTTTQIIHKEFGYVGKNWSASSWRNLEEEPMVLLTDFAGMMSVNDDPTGARRIADIQSVILMLRYLISPRTEFFSLRNLKGRRDINFICPDNIVCPRGVRELIEYAMGLTAPITDDMYRIVGEHIERLLETYSA